MRPGYFEEHEYDADDERETRLIDEARALVLSLSLYGIPFGAPVYQKALRRVKRREKVAPWYRRSDGKRSI